MNSETCGNAAPRHGLIKYDTYLCSDSHGSPRIAPHMEVSTACHIFQKKNTVSHRAAVGVFHVEECIDEFVKGSFSLDIYGKILAC